MDIGWKKRSNGKCGKKSFLIKHQGLVKRNIYECNAKSLRCKACTKYIESSTNPLQVARVKLTKARTNETDVQLMSHSARTYI